MKRVSLFGASAVAIAASMLNGAGEALAGAARGVHRVAAGTKRARRMVSVRTPHNRSKYMPHIGAKERERAKRLYESHHLNDKVVDITALMGGVAPAHLRSMPTLCQMSKRQHAPQSAG